MQSHTAHKPTALRGKDTEHQPPHDKRTYIHRKGTSLISLYQLDYCKTSKDLNDNFCDIFPNFRKKEGTIFHENRLQDSPEISCLICYFLKSGKILNCLLLQIIGGALRVK